VCWRTHPIHPPLRQRSRGLEASGCPPFGQMLQGHGSLELGLTRVRRQMPHCCCPISTSRAREQEGHGRPCRSPQLSAPIQMPPCSTLRSRGTSCFDHVIPESASDIQRPAMVPAIGGRSQATAAHLVEFAGGLGLRLISLQPALPSLGLRLCAQPCHSEIDQLERTFPILRSW